MSTEQSESAHSQGETQTAHSQVDITQQATTPTPTSRSAQKIPSVWLLANWLLKERGWPANNRKKAAAEAAFIIANNKAKAAATAAPEPAPTTEDETPKSTGEKNSSLSTTQWLAVASLVVSLVWIYYKREELKTVFSSKKTPEPARVEPQPARATQPKGLRHMD